MKSSAKGWRPKGVDWAILLVALAVRLILLDVKPAHFDEGVNGWFVDQLIKTGTFQYDPSNYHGPFHFYVLFISQVLFGRGLWQLRIPVVIASVLTVWLIIALRRHLPAGACRVAAVAMAISPAFVFYGRYSIHEPWLILFLVMFLHGIYGLVRENRPRDLWIAGMALVGMILTKETYVLHVVAFGLAVPCLLLWEKVVPSTDAAALPVRQWGARDLWQVGGVSLALLVFFYSGNFQNFAGLTGPFETFMIWAKTGTDGHGHEKDWWYWLWLMWKLEWPVLLGLAACLRFLLPATRAARFLTIYGAGTLLAYSIINYKTPWCNIAIYWPFLLLFGILLVEAMRTRLRWPALALAMVALVHSSWHMARLNFIDYTNDSEPYVYVQTYEDINLLLDPLFEKVKEDPTAMHLPGYILSRSVYPLPWILADFTGVVYHDRESMPEPPDAAFILVDEDQAERFRTALKAEYIEHPVRLRSGQEPLVLFMNLSEFPNLAP